MAKVSSVKKPSAQELAQENKRLMAENETLKKQVAKKIAAKSPLKWRGPVIGLCAALAAALLILGNIFFWTGNTILNTNRYIATVSPLIKDPQIQSGLATYTTNTIFANNDVQGAVSQVLPPKADFLAPQLTTQLKTVTQKTVQGVLASPKFQQVWTDTQTKTHQRLVNFVENYQGDGVIDLNDVFTHVTSNLADTKLSFLVGKQLPAKYGSIKIATVGWLPAAHKLSVNIGTYQAVTTGLFAAFIAVAIWLSDKHRRTVAKLSALFAAMMLATLISIRILKHLVVSDVASTYQPAVKAAANIVVKPLVEQTAGLFAASGLISVVAWLGGSSKAAKAVQTRLQALLAGKLHESIFKNENSLSHFVGKYKRPLFGLIIAGALLVLLLISLSIKTVVLTGIITGLLAVAVEILAAPTLR